MSTTSYQTNAKPRSRRGSLGESSDRQPGSRPSSSPSLRLSKTLSRTLDEVSVPRNSRPTSPAVYVYRPRGHDHRQSDPLLNSSRRSGSSIRSTRYIDSVIENDRPRVTEPIRQSTIIANSSHLSSQTVESASDAAVNAQSHPEQLSPPLSPTSTETLDSDDINTEPTRSLSSRSIHSMQPTVAEESEEIVTTVLGTSSPGSSTVFPVSSPTIATSSNALPIPIVPGAFPPTAATDPDLGLADPKSMVTAAAAEPQVQDPLLAPTPKASIAFIDLGDTGEVESTVPITNNSAPDKATSDTKSRTPFTSPPRSPTYPHYASRPPSQPPPGLYPFPYPHVMNNSPYQQAFYPPFPPSNMGFTLPEAIARTAPAGTEEERKRLLEKVSSVLPDINRLLHYYQESQGLLTEKDHLVKQVETRHEEAINKMRIELSVTKEEYERIIGEQAGENLRLKSDVSEQAEKISHLNEIQDEFANLQGRHKALLEELEASKALNEELTMKKGHLQDEIEGLKNQIDAINTSHERLVEDMNETHAKVVADKDDSFARVVGEHKSNLSKIQLDLAGMITKHTQQKKDLDYARSAIIDLEGSLAAKDKELDDARDSHEQVQAALISAAEEKHKQHVQETTVCAEKLAESISKHSAEVELLKTSHQDEMERFQQAADQERSKLTSTLERCEAQLQNELDAAQATMEDLKSELDKERGAREAVEAKLVVKTQEHSILKERHETANTHHADLAKAMLSLRAKQTELQQESERMDQILQSIGEIGHGKGDAFFIESFDRLASLIEEVSKHFVIDRSREASSPGIFYDKAEVLGINDSAASSRDLQSLVVQNRIWTVLQRRIFEPFLFTSDYGALEQLGIGKSLKMVSWLMRRKSLRREAIWRSLTMQTLYASAYGRKAAAATALSVTKEIMRDIQAIMADDSHSALLCGVRLIAKAAIQIWRRVRLELDSVYSTMTMAPSPGEDASPSDVVMWIRPHITKEGLMGDWLSKNMTQSSGALGSSCVFLQGTALRPSPPLVLVETPLACQDYNKV
ncbi:hypothetical protein H2204_015174 [Knufia peltigerae]|uniref:Uncharacterized protein n=1 Tax=Knufia peltigerae TaxID=1002370 RepID=A0AA39CKP4_9EURO|nr:hypothetical protein H2204_015174 [Knufia peltigerae]